MVEVEGEGGGGEGLLGLVLGVVGVGGELVVFEGEGEVFHCCRVWLDGKGFLDSVLSLCAWCCLFKKT